jgi:hypothetical protein
MPRNRSPTPLPVLRVAVCLAQPWAFVDGLCLDGIEVRAMRRYARWRGHELCWLHVEESRLPETLSSGGADIAIGGLCDTPALARHARLVRFGARALCLQEPRHAANHDHVWAINPHSIPEWAAACVFLNLRQWRERFSAGRPAGTDAAASYPPSQEYLQ